MLTAELLMKSIQNIEYSFSGSLKTEIYKVSYYEKDECAKKGVLYVMPGEKRISKAVTADSCVLYVPAEAVREVSAQLTDLILKDYQRASALLQFGQEVFHDAGTGELLALCKKIMGNPVWLLNSTFQPLLLTAEEPFHFPVRELLQMKNLTFEKETLLLEGAPACPYQQIIGRIRHNGRVAGYLYAAALTVPFIPAVDQYYVNQMCMLLGLRPSLEESGEKSTGKHRLLVDLITNQITDEEIAAQRMRHVNWHPSEKYYVLSVELGSKIKRPDNIREQMEAFLGTEMYLHQGYCIAILGSPAYKNLSVYDFRSLTEYLERMDLYVGLSYGFLNVLEAARAFKQSMIAPGLRKRLTAGIHLARYEDVVFMHLIQIADEHGIPPGSFCHPVVKKIHQYDEEYGTEYLRTLTAYIHFNQGLQENADALYIHRNTMYKRIGFLKDYFQIDFDNHRLVMKLRVSTQIYSYMGWLNIQDINGPFE